MPTRLNSYQCLVYWSRVRPPGEIDGHQIDVFLRRTLLLLYWFMVGNARHTLQVNHVDCRDHLYTLYAYIINGP